MTFKDDDFLLLRFPVHQMDNEGTFYRKFKELSIYPEFPNNKNTTEIGHNITLVQVMRYIVFMYDINSPLLEIRQLHRRKAEALLQSGFLPGSNGRFPKYVERLILNEYYTINRMIVRYLRIQHNSDFELLVTYEEKLSDVMRKLISEDIEEKDRDIIMAADMLREKIKELEQTLFRDNVEKDILKVMYDEMENEQLQLRPEDIAKKTKAKGLEKIYEYYED